MEEQYIENTVVNNNPHNLDAERYVLGSIFLDNTIISSLNGRLSPSDFYLKLHQNLYEVMQALDKSSIVIDALHVQEYYEIKGYGSKESILDAIVNITESVPSTAYIDTYVDMVKEKSVERELLVNIGQLKNDILNNNLSYNDVLGNAEKKLYDVIRLQRTADTVIIGDAAEEYYNEVIKRSENKGELTGLDTGYKKLNTLTNGFQKGEMIIIAARPSVGKTAFALNLAKNISEKGGAVGFFSLEMSVNQIMQRMYSMITHIPSDNFKKGTLSNEQKVQVGVARQTFQDYRIYFDESGSSTIGDIRNKCRQLKQTKQLDCVIIDYLQLINTENKVRHEGVSEISRSLKQLARELEIPVIALSQLNRSIETRDDKMPSLADIRESGSIEQDADIVMFLFNRKDIEDEEESVIDVQQEQIDMPPVVKDYEEDPIKDVVLLIGKNRQGSLGHIDFEFYGAESYFTQNKIQKELIRKKKRKIRK